MPIIYNHSYKPPFLFRNYHMNTIFPALFRKIKKIDYQRMRISTPDDDFLDIDFSKADSNSLVIIIHGLEGNAGKPYMKGLVRSMNNADIDAVAINLRDCSGKPNRKYYSYHSGKTEDLETVIKFIIENYKYKKIYLAGFSLGGNLVLKYVGERGNKINPIIKAAIGISVPCDLKATAYNFLKKDNWLYQKRFILSLRKKALNKLKLFPEYQHLEKGIKKSKTFLEFDNLVTAAANGFKDAEDYWKQSSCKQFLTSIRIPTLLISALDDPFLPKECYPYEEAEQNPNFYFETPKYGGHVGFINGYPLSKELWSEKRVLEFFSDFQ
ncbi:MAG: alpha/beta fold hydrolase [Bacteroidota bacterium]